MKKALIVSSVRKTSSIDRYISDLIKSLGKTIKIDYLNLYYKFKGFKNNKLNEIIS